MKRYLVFLLLWVLPLAAADADKITVRPSDFETAMRMIGQRLDFPQGSLSPQVDIKPQATTFMSRLPLRHKTSPLPGEPRSQEDDFFIITTQFFMDSPTIEKRVLINQGRDNGARVRFALTEGPERFDKFFYEGLGLPMQVYNRSGEMFVYAQMAAPDGTVNTREWIYARQPNCPQGSRYHWVITSDEFNRRLVLAPEDQGGVDIRRQYIVKGVNAFDYSKQRHIINTVKKAFGDKIHITGEDTIGQIEPVFYRTREGLRKHAGFSIVGYNQLVVEINEPASSYPLLIESE